MNITNLARRQLGVVTREQALGTGLTASAIRHLLTTGRWQRMHPGIYVTHTGSVTWTERASGALLHAGPGAALGLQSAAFHSRLTSEEPSVIQVFIPLDRRVTAAEGMDVRRRRRFCAAPVSRLQTTLVAQTVIDLSAEPDQSDDDVVALVTRVCQKGRSTDELLLDELRARRSHPRRELLQLALWDVRGGVESVAEFRFLRDVARRHGLPPLVCQAATGDGGRRDFESEEYAVIIEIDGARWHQGERLRGDRQRDRDAVREGKVTLRAGWDDVTLRACELAVDIIVVLWERGWLGRPTPCSSSCPVSRLVQPAV